MSIGGIHLGWKTITGAVVAGIGAASQPDVMAVLPHKVASGVTIAGAVLSVIGLRHAVAKAGQ